MTDEEVKAQVWRSLDTALERDQNLHLKTYGTWAIAVALSDPECPDYIPDILPRELEPHVRSWQERFDK